MLKSFEILILVLLAVNFVHSLPSYVRTNTPENIERLNNLGPDDYAEFLSGQFEGDMVLSPEEIELLIGEGRGGRTGLIERNMRWTDNIVPYTIREADFTSAQIHYIHLGAQRLNEVSCLRFVPYNPAVHENYIWVTGANSGCWSYVGMVGGRQQLNLQPFDIEVGCFRLGTVIHEYLHAVGFFHMQSATERDEYVQIVWENIQNGTQRNFEKYNASTISNFGVEYDYGSVMHYPATAFSINGSATIVPLRPLGENIMGQRVRVSDKDILRLNRMYCRAPVHPPPESLSAFFDRMNYAMNKMFRHIFSKFN